MTHALPARTARNKQAAILLSVCAHALLLFLLMQLGQNPAGRRGANTPGARPAIEVMLLAQPLAALRAVVPPAVPTPAPSMQPSAARQRLDAPVPRPPPQLSATKSEFSLQAMGSPQLVPDSRGGEALSEPFASPAKTGAVAAVAPRADLQATTAASISAPGPAELRPTQVARPDYGYNPQPEYPIALREQGIGGVVWLRVWVDVDGHPAEIKLSKGSGYRMLDDAALRAVKMWRFVPARHGEQRLASWVEFPIRFTMSG